MKINFIKSNLGKFAHIKELRQMCNNSLTLTLDVPKQEELKRLELKAANDNLPLMVKTAKKKNFIK